MKLLIFALCVVFVCGGLSAQTPAWQLSPGHTQVPIWPGAAPDAQPVAEPEDDTAMATESLVAGRPWVQVGNVSRPTMTVYSPKGKNTGAAVVVFPGGGYTILAMDLEGTEVCDWLTSKGITCVLLKYRVPGVGLYPKSGPYPESPMALEVSSKQRVRGSNPSGRATYTFSIILRPSVRHSLVTSAHRFLDDVAVKEMDRAISNTRVAWIVSDHTNGCAIGVQLA